MVAGHHDQLGVVARLAQGRQRRGGGVEHAGDRLLAQLEEVAEHHHPVGLRERLDQPLARLGHAQHVAAGDRAEVEVGHHCREHGGGSWQEDYSPPARCPSSVVTTATRRTARSARRRRCPPSPRGARPTRRPAASKGKKKPPPGPARSAACTARPGPTRTSRSAATRCAWSACPGGCDWPSGSWPPASCAAARRYWTPADLPGLVERAIEKGVVGDADAEKLTAALAAEQGRGVSRGRIGRVLGGAARRAAGGRPGAGGPLDRASRQRLGAPGDAGDAAGGALRRGLRGRGVRCLGTRTTLTS